MPRRATWEALGLVRRQGSRETIGQEHFLWFLWGGTGKAGRAGLGLASLNNFSGLCSMGAAP